MSLIQAVLFDLDGVLTDTAEFHYQSWQHIADQMQIPFDRQANEALRGLSREESLLRVLGARAAQFGAAERAEIARRKNDRYLELVSNMSPADLLPGAREILAAVRQAGLRTAVGSSSRNANLVLDRLGIRGSLDAVVDGVDAPRSKPDPLVFQMAAQRVGATAPHCVVVEDAESGVQAGLAAGMWVVGLGPEVRVGQAHLRRASLAELSVQDILTLPERARTTAGNSPAGGTDRKREGVKHHAT